MAVQGNASGVVCSGFYTPYQCILLHTGAALHLCNNYLLQGASCTVSITAEEKYCQQHRVHCRTKEGPCRHVNGFTNRVTAV